jgi:hypothetical protein
MICCSTNPGKTVSICRVTPSPNSSTESSICGASSRYPPDTERMPAFSYSSPLVSVFIMVKLTWLPPSPPTITPPFCSRRLRRKVEKNRCSRLAW